MDRVNHSRVIRFGVFEVDLHSKELFNHGHRIRMEGQPFQVLSMLLKRPGELISRKELQRRLWPGDTFVDFDHSLNVAIKRLREVLHDSADTPRYIETLPRRGYRFIYPVADGSNRRSTPIPLEAELQNASACSRPSVSSPTSQAQPKPGEKEKSGPGPPGLPRQGHPPRTANEAPRSSWLKWEAGLIGSVFAAAGLLLWRNRPH